MNSILSVMRKEFRHMLRDPWALVTVTFGAALLMVLMAYTFSADVEDVPIVVVDADRSPQSRAYLAHFANDVFFDVVHWAPDYEAGREWVRSGRVHAAIVVPPGFSEALLRGDRSRVQILVDGIDPTVAQQVVGNVEAISANHSVELLEQRLARAGFSFGGESPPFEFRVRALFNPNLKEVNSVLPGLMAIVLAMPALSAALSLAREREQGSLEGLMATPIRRHQLLIGKVVPYLLLGLADIFLFTLAGLIIFDVPFRGSVFDLVVASGLFLLANVGIGLLISSLVRSQMAALIIAGFLFMMPPINEAGIFHPLYAMPPDAQMQAMVWPATHYVAIARGIFLKGAGLLTFVFDVLFLLGMGVVFNGLAVWRLKKKLG
jgi:ABC-2 type transport system permease protein